ncbi:hypothetical protein OG21DRAFT_1515573 [Imleria badia]|nr:hypothetical protein OG21DRAFT_1515573 [Imleria badia]
MPNLKSYAGPTSKLVVAFDIGTTYSGISYCFLERGRVPEVLGVTRFPGQAAVGGDAKVPSLLYYDRTGNIKAAGAEVLTEGVLEAALTEEWTRVEWWKLHLRPKYLASSINPGNDLPPLPPGKSAVDVLTDFIKYLLHCAKTYIQDHHFAFTWSTFEDSIEYIFTHPNGWEGVQQQLYRRAIERAGLIPHTPEGRSRVHMLTDNEAALHFCVPNLSAEIADQALQGVVIIDAGGGTIDLSMYSMTCNPIFCEEIAPAECLLQGSVFVTRMARALLEKKLEGSEHPRPNEFRQGTKLIIETDQDPTSLRVDRRRSNNPKYNIAFGKLKLMGAEATGPFNDSIDAIISAFEQQQKSATIPITTAFLVGGLSINDWLWSRLQSYFKEKNINICRPDIHINKAVANGAVLSHVDREHHMIASRTTRATYGIIHAVRVQANNEEHVRREKKWERDPTGNRYVPGYFESKLRKGAHVREEMEFRESFSLTERNTGDFGLQTVRLVCYRGSLSDPKWVDQDQSAFSPFCTIRVDLSEAANDLVLKKTAGRAYYQLDYDVIMLFGLTELQAYLGWKSKDGERRVAATVTFD